MIWGLHLRAQIPIPSKVDRRFHADTDRVLARYGIAIAAVLLVELWFARNGAILMEQDSRESPMLYFVLGQNRETAGRHGIIAIDK